MIRTHFSLALAILFWSSCFVAIRTGLTGFTPEPVSFFRMSIAAASMILFGIAKGIRLPRLRDVPILFFHGVVGITVFNVAIFHGAKLISIGSTSFIVSTVPVIATVLAVLFLKERITWLNALGLAVSMGGVCLISFGEGGGLTLNIGAFFVLIAAFSDSLYNVLQKPMLKRYTSVEYATYTLTAGALSLSPYMPELLDQFGEAPAAAVGGVLYLGTFGTAVPYALWSYSISRCGVCHIVVFQYAIPILGTIIGYVVLGETSPEMALWGGALALLGAVISWLPPRFRPKFHMRGGPVSSALGGRKRKAVSPATVRSPVRRDGDNSGP
jgi:drug/metabolite transporter (DMT)-like permease